MAAPPTDSVLTTVLQALANQTASGNSGNGVGLPFSANGYVFHNDTTVVQTVGGDTFDLKIQTSFDGTLWFDVCAFAQLVGGNAARARMMKIAKAVDENLQSNEDRIVTLTPTASENFFGVLYRARWIITGASPSFTFSVLALPI